MSPTGFHSKVLNLMYTERVFKSSDNRLYLTGGSNNVTSLYTEAGFASLVDRDAWGSRLAERRLRVESGGARFIQLIVPEKLTVYPLGDADRQQVFPGYTKEEIVSPGRRLINAIGTDGIVYPDQFLQDQAGSFPVYPPTDSHWSWKGAFSAFQLLTWTLQYAPAYRDFVNLPKRRLHYRGDLWEPTHGDMGAGDEFERVELPRQVTRIYANPLMGLKERLNKEDEVGLHSGSHCIFINPSSQFDEIVVLFGSSFSEARLPPSLLTAIFAYYFRAVHFIWSPALDYDYLARHPAALVVAEIPERFLTDCPMDRLDIEKNALDKMRQWSERTLSGGTEWESRWDPAGGATILP
jgi:alginate O-acetyltransferase complex protein AlgJ